MPANPSATDIVAIARFYSAHVVHSAFDVSACSVPGYYARALFYNNLFYKLFYSDQPLGLHCGQAALGLGALFEILGFSSRRLSFEGEGIGHLATEVFDGERWVLVDADFDCVIRDAETGELVGADALFDYPSRALSVESLTGKRWLCDQFNFSWGFRGSFAWMPGQSHLSLCSDEYLKAAPKLARIVKRRINLHNGYVFSSDGKPLIVSRNGKEK